MLSLVVVILIFRQRLNGLRAYHNDLRNAVVFQRIILRLPVGIVANQNGISIRTVQRYVERYAHFGTIAPDADIFGETRGRNITLVANDVSTLIHVVLDVPTLYLDEIQEELVERGARNMSIQSVHVWLNSLGFTRQRLYRV